MRGIDAILQFGFQAPLKPGEAPAQSCSFGVNTFLDPQGSPTVIPAEVIRATKAEKEYAIASRDAFQARNAAASATALADLKQVALAHGNLFASLMEVSKVCTLGQISGALYEVGGQYRRNM